jgi:AcrR family transcriptional regulator
MAARAGVGDTRRPLTTERVLRAAIELADRDGVDALSMRKVARELGFEVMSLYNHVASKDAMLDAMLDLVTAEIERLPIAGDGDWRMSIRTAVMSARDVMLRHPWALTAWPLRTPGPARLAFIESLLRGLRQAGFPAELAYHAYHAVLMHILGFTMQEVNFSADVDDLAGAATAYLRQLPVEQFPYFAEHVEQHVHPDERGSDFQFVLDLILDGLERARLETTGGINPDGRR